MKKYSTTPVSDIAKRVAAIMHRRPESKWNQKKEIIPFVAIKNSITEEDLAMVERYYKKNWPPRTSVNHLRHDLATLINNWQGEVDRARIWCDAHPIVRKIIPLPIAATSPQPEITIDPEERDKFMAEYEQRKTRKLAGPM